MILHKDFAGYCARAIELYNTGFLLPGGELLLRDSQNELITHVVVIRKSNAVFPLSHSSILAAYKRSCELVFGYLCLPTQLPNNFDSLMHSDIWPAWQKASKSKFKRISSQDEEKQRTETKRAKLGTEQNYRLRVDRDRIATFLATDKRWIEKFIPNIQKYAVLAWGVVEQCLERTRDPFRRTPLMVYGNTAAEWLNSVLTATDVSSMALAMRSYDEFLFDHVLYRNKKFIVAKRDGAPPLVFLNEPRPVTDCPEAFLTAFFFYLYAGGKMDELHVTEPSQLTFCLLDPVVKPLMAEIDRQQTLSDYKHVLSEITGGRTHQQILNQFRTVEEMAQHLIVDAAELKFDIPTVYVQPESRRVIKLADSAVCRWTNLTANAPARNFAADRNVREALTLSSDEVDVSALKALAAEASLTLDRVMFLFSDCTCSINEEKLRETYREHENLVRGERLNLKILKAITHRLQLEELNDDYVMVKPDIGIVYAAGKFHEVHPTCRGETSDLLTTLNRKEHLQLLNNCEYVLLASDLFTIDLDFAEYFVIASKGKLASPLQQAEMLREKVGFPLKTVLRDAFTNGPWKQTIVASNVAATLFAAFENVGTYWTEFERFWESEENMDTVPLYVVQNSDSRLLVSYSKDYTFTVYEINVDVIERHERLTELCNQYDGAKLLDTPLARDNSFIVFMLHLGYKFKKEYAASYGDLLARFKREVHILSAATYNIDFVSAVSFGIFDGDRYGDGEKMVTFFVEETFFSLTKPYVVRTAINATSAMEEIANKWNIGVQKISVGSCGSALFVKDTMLSPVLYLYNKCVDSSSDELYSTLFDMWVASDSGTTGFLMLPVECESESRMDLDDDVDILPHYLTLVYTSDLFAVPLVEPKTWYGAVVKDRPQIHHSDIYRKLLRWITAGQNLSAKDVADVLSWHSMTLLRYRLLPTSVIGKRFSINYFDQLTLNNTLSTITPDVVKKITIKEHFPYASVQLSKEEFTFLFAMKQIK